MSCRWLLENWIRATSWVAVSIGVLAACEIQSTITVNKPAFDLFSYWGIVATLAALLIAIAEIAQSIKATKSLQEQTQTAILNLKNIENASTVSDCIAEIDIITRAISEQRYEAALNAFQHFQKICVRTFPSYQAPASGAAANLNVLGDIELRLLSACRSTVAAGLNKAQKHALVVDMLKVKAAIQACNPANNTRHTSK